MPVASRADAARLALVRKIYPHWSDFISMTRTRESVSSRGAANQGRTCQRHEVAKTVLLRARRYRMTDASDSSAMR